MTLYKWSTVASNNASVDATINWAEGQAPSSVNDSARATMAAIAKWRNDTGGTLQTAGTSTAYTVSSSQGFTTAALMDTASLNLLFHATNGASPTLNVDGLGAVAITIDGTNPPPVGSLVAGTPYVFVYYNSGNTWRMKNFYQVPYHLPIGGIIPYAGSSAPNSSFVIPLGQAVSRTTYAVLFALIGTTYGIGDGSTTFNVPDLGGRAVFGKEASATRLTTAGGGLDGGTLAAVGGAQNVTLITANLPAYTPAGTITNGAITSTVTGGTLGATSTSTAVSAAGVQLLTGSTAIAVGSSQAASTFVGAAQGGSSTAVKTVSPGIVMNNLMRVL